MVRRLSTITAVFVVALAGAAHAASSSAILGGTPSVTAVHSHGKTVVTFKGKQGRRLYKRIAGHRVDLSCQDVQTDPTVTFELSGAVGDLDVPNRGGKLRADISGDWCEVLLLGKRKKVSPIVAVGLTSLGKSFLNERLYAVTVDAVMTIARSGAKDGHYPTADHVVAKLGSNVVTLGSPSDMPPPGKFGFYSDGAQHIAAVGVAKSGKRLFEEANGDVVSSNLFAYMSSLEFDTLT